MPPPRAAVAVVALLLAGACTHAHRAPLSGASTCSPVPGRADGLPEVHAGGPLDLWALIFNGARGETKIAWRVGGRGPLAITAADSRSTIEPSEGPQPHGDSSWHRPGDEYGTVFRFPHAGCWTVTATRGHQSS